MLAAICVVDLCSGALQRIAASLHLSLHLSRLFGHHAIAYSCTGSAVTLATRELTAHNLRHSYPRNFAYDAPRGQLPKHVQAAHATKQLRLKEAKVIGLQACRLRVQLRPSLSLPPMEESFTAGKPSLLYAALVLATTHEQSVAGWDAIVTAW